MEENNNEENFKDVHKETELDLGKAITAISYSPDGKFVAGVQGNRIILWLRDSGRMFRSFNSHNKLVCIAYNPDGSEIVVGDVNGHATVYSKGGKLLRHLN